MRKSLSSQRHHMRLPQLATGGNWCHPVFRLDGYRARTLNPTSDHEFDQFPSCCKEGGTNSAAVRSTRIILTFTEERLLSPFPGGFAGLAVHQAQPGGPAASAQASLRRTPSHTVLRGGKGPSRLASTEHHGEQAARRDENDLCQISLFRPSRG